MDRRFHQLGKFCPCDTGKAHAFSCFFKEFWDHVGFWEGEEITPKAVGQKMDNYCLHIMGWIVLKILLFASPGMGKVASQQHDVA